MKSNKNLFLNPGKRKKLFIFKICFSRKAIKEIDLRRKRVQEIAEIFQEALQMSQFKHENITKYHEHFTDLDDDDVSKKENFLYIVYEYCEVSNSNLLE
jgi:hypothetical protein